MKRFVCIALLMVMLITMLSACGVFKCDLCGKMIVGNKHDVRGKAYEGGAEVMTDTAFLMNPFQEVCDDCIEYFED